MPGVSRRQCIGATLGAAAASAQPLRVKAPGKPGIKLSEVLAPGQPAQYRLFRQIGVNHAILTASLTGQPRSRYAETIGKWNAEFKAAGLTIAGIESLLVSLDKVKLGLPGRDEEIEDYQAALRAVGEAGIPMVLYNFTIGLGWVRTTSEATERGGALVTAFDLRDAEKQGPAKVPPITEEKLWSNLEYFLKAVMPVAEKAGVKMALHPDDPPLSPLRGVPRIITSGKNFRRVLSIAPSPMNGITFCQANFKLMGEDIGALAQEFCTARKIFFVHFRDVVGTRERFRETFHDNGPTDMARMLEIYHKYGFDGPMRPDHAPTLEGEANDRPGYAFQGKILAFGYMKGVMDALHIPYA